MPSQDEYLGISVSHLYKAKAALEDAATIYVHKTMSEEKPIAVLLEELHWLQEQLDFIDIAIDNITDYDDLFNKVDHEKPE